MKKFFAVAALFISSQIFAQLIPQQREPDSSTLLDPVVLTATKLPQKQSNTGKVVSVIGKEQIEKNSSRTVAQLLNEQAGITISGALNNLGTNQTIYMRGASSGRTLVLLDGIPVNDPTMINNEFDLNLLSLNNIERIEVCRGAQSTLYGSDAVAGVINIITMKNDVAKPFNIKTTLSGGKYDTYRGNTQLYGKADKLTYAVRYGKLMSRGFSSAYDSTGKKGFDNDGVNSDVASASLQLQATDHLSFRTFAQYSHYRSELDAGAFSDERDYTAKNKSLITGGGFQYGKKNVTFRGNYQYSYINRNYFNDRTDIPGFIVAATDDYFGQNQFVELYSSIGLGRGFTLLSGADYRFSSIRSQYSAQTSFGGFTNTLRDTAHHQSSLYASLFYKALHEKLNAELGGRLNEHSRYGRNYTFTFNPSYSINKQFRLFASIATGFKAPTLFQLYSNSGNKDLKPEQSKTYEAGIHHTISKIQNRVVYFHREIENGLDFNYLTFHYFNFLHQTVNGLELETAAQPVTGLTISGNYTFLDSKEKTQSRINFKDTTYSYLLKRPKHHVNLSVGYQIQKGPFISVAAKYASSRYDVGGYAANDVLLKSYWLLNAYAEYKIESHLKVFADAQNLTNKKFFDVRGYNSIPFIFNGGVTITL